MRMNKKLDCCCCCRVNIWMRLRHRNLLPGVLVAAVVVVVDAKDFFVVGDSVVVVSTRMTITFVVVEFVPTDGCSLRFSLSFLILTQSRHTRSHYLKTFAFRLPPMKKLRPHRGLLHFSEMKSICCCCCRYFCFYFSCEKMIVFLLSLHQLKIHHPPAVQCE